jgi:hypothetical protein
MSWITSISWYQDKIMQYDSPARNRDVSAADGGACQASTNAPQWHPGTDTVDCSLTSSVIYFSTTQQLQLTNIYHIKTAEWQQSKVQEKLRSTMAADYVLELSMRDGMPVSYPTIQVHSIRYEKLSGS